MSTGPEIVRDVEQSIREFRDTGAWLGIPDNCRLSDSEATDVAEAIAGQVRDAIRAGRAVRVNDTLDAFTVEVAK